VSFTKTCGKCSEPIGNHIVVRMRTGEHVICPHVHKAAWMKKWSWKFKTTEDAERSYRRVAFRAGKVGQPGPRKPGSHAPMSRQTEVCDYCRLSRSLHEGRALYCPTDKNMREEPDERTRFGKRPIMMRYAVFDKEGFIVGFVKARWVVQAQNFADKHYGHGHGVMYMTRKVRVGDNVHTTKASKKMRNRAPWNRKSKSKSKKACGYCGRKVKSGSSFTDKKYGTLCPRCTVRVNKARETAKTMRDPKQRYYVTVRFLYNGKPQQYVYIIPADSSFEARHLSKFKLPKSAVWLGATATKMTARDPKKKKSKSLRWVDFIRKMKNNPKYRTADGKLDLKKLARAFKGMRPHVRTALMRKANSLIKNTKHPDMNALSIAYSPIHQAYLVLWNGHEILALRQSKEAAREFIRNLTAKVSNDPKTRNTTHKYPYGVYYRWAGKDYNDGYRFLGLKWKFLTSYTNIAEAQAKVRKLKSEGLDAKWGRRDVIDRPEVERYRRSQRKKIA
jgi:hypothetical protein